MVKGLIEIDENTNRVLSVVRAKHGLKDKGKAVEWIVGKFIESQNEPELKPEFVEKMKRIERQKSILVEDFFDRYALN
jgi:hypothetical protein